MCSSDLVACFFDIEKAFDKMCHEEFVLKAKKAGILDDTVGLMLNYLSGRSIRLRINGVLSEPVTLRAGTPQGSILSPTLFGIWVSDLPAPPPGVRVSQFADDIGVWASGRTADSAIAKLEDYCPVMVEWCRMCKILLSASKTQVIAFRKDRADPGPIYIMLDGERIESSNEATFLGVVLDPQLTLVKHHAKITKELRRRLGMLRGIAGSPLKPRAPSDMCSQIVRSMIEPVCTYAASVTVVRKEHMFREQDLYLTRAYRVALHGPKTLSSQYVRAQVGLGDTRDTTIRLARDYVFSPERSGSFQRVLAELVQRERRAASSPRYPSPLRVLGLGQ